MSHSPDEVPEDATLDDVDAAYVNSVVRLNKMLDRGVSWSGHEANCVFLNTRGERFANISAITGIDFLDDGRGLGLVDWDFDGDLDAWTTNRTAPMVRFVRNELPAGQRFLAVRLRGVTANRDAINARVEVRLSGDSSAKLLRTLRAGEGFLGQSSKWVHFGLGGSDSIEQLTVHWPGGESESFTGVETNSRYLLQQGTGVAEPWMAPRGPIELAPRPAEAPGASPVTRTLLSSRIPLPPMRLRTFSGQEVDLSQRDGEPCLVTLWASWCLPCLRELHELSEHEALLRDAGLEVFAASVDGLGDRRGADERKVRQILERVNYAFESGMADADLTAKVELTVNYVYGPNRSIIVPTSLLVDGDGNLAAIYRGSVAADQLMADVATLTLKGERQYAAALPFPGRWLANAPQLRPLPLAIELATGGYDAEAIEYVRRNGEQFRRDRGFAAFAAELSRKLVSQKDYGAARRHLAEAVRLAPRDAELRAQLGDLDYLQQNWGAAERRFKEALALDPENVKANFQMGNLLNRQGKFEPATQLYEAALRGDPALADAHYQLAGALFRQRRIKDATRHMSQYVALRPDDAGALANLGGLLASQRRFADAERYLRKAAEIAPDNKLVRGNLERVLREQGKVEEADAIRSR